ncbi:FAD-dependent monooxygenase [Streptomyces huiliensis]|uniref:FAD-dependent monooxygenase n=1 Tax=Streptomyces huiliensis TaxID=2876027 RepID=UPI001CC0B4EF|nr:FAD-dependent monooxygenase [Streptomyces huiliensis]MBZ4320935.1 FAD-dependent monooxygenase [Streptomyces huiliensis]
MTRTTTVPPDTAVLIVGAGPAGLTLACVLARAGVAVRVVDKAPEFHRESRGKGLNQRGREIFEDLDVGDAATASGIEHITLRKYRGGVAVSDHVSFGDKAPTADAPYASGLIIPQWRTEEILRDRLAGLGVEVELRSELTGFDQDEHGVTATLADGRRIRADWLVGCDGGRGSVRKLLGLSFEGATEAEECMVIGDVRADGLDPAYWHQWFDEDGGIMLCPFRGSDHWQLQAAPERDADGAVLPPSPESFQRIFDRHARVPGVRLTDVRWTSVYRINVRMADRFRVGRVLLAGDAAHVHSIAGGLGMNTGIQDAFNLGWKLAFVARGEAAEPLLDTYEEERLPVAAWTLRLTDERLGAVREGVRRAGVGTEAVVTDDTTTLRVAYPWSSLAWGGADAGHRAGGVRRGEGGPWFTLRGPAGPELRRLAGKYGPLVRVQEDPAARDLLLVRPDHHVALRVAPSDAGEVAKRLDGLRPSPSGV